jgi:hypothetical protein
MTFNTSRVGRSSPGPIPRRPPRERECALWASNPRRRRLPSFSLLGRVRFRRFRIKWDGRRISMRARSVLSRRLERPCPRPRPPVLVLAVQQSRHRLQAAPFPLRLRREAPPTPTRRSERDRADLNRIPIGREIIAERDFREPGSPARLGGGRTRLNPLRVLIGVLTGSRLLPTVERTTNLKWTRTP